MTFHSIISLTHVTVLDAISRHNQHNFKLVFATRIRNSCTDQVCAMLSITRTGILIHKFEDDFLVIALNVLHNCGIPIGGEPVFVISPPYLYT